MIGLSVDQPTRFIKHKGIVYRVWSWNLFQKAVNRYNRTRYELVHPDSKEIIILNLMVSKVLDSQQILGTKEKGVKLGDNVIHLSNYYVSMENIPHQDTKLLKYVSSINFSIEVFQWRPYFNGVGIG